MSRESYERVPAFAASIALHAGIIAAAILLGAILSKPVIGPQVVPVALINTADLNPAPSVETPTPTEAETPPTPPTPEVAPAPTPPTPTPAPKPIAAAKSTPTPTPKPTPVAKPTMKTVKAEPDDDKIFNNLSQSLAKGAAPAKAKPPSHTTPGTGDARSAAARTDLARQLGDLWNPNCGVLGGADVNIVVKFELLAGGRMRGTPTSTASDASDPLVKAASDRAVRAVYRYFSDPSRPYADLPPATYAINFNPKTQCAQR